MEEEELFGKMLFVAREAALFLLRERESVLPFAVTMDNSGEDPQSYYPGDSWPEAGWEELLDAAAEHLAAHAASQSVAACALVTGLESDTEFGIGIQVETRAAALLMIYPYEKSSQGWILREPKRADGLLREPVLAG